ncbi:MAG: DJ-1/PfpI family protein [Peptococcaceae bacterium]
MITIGILIFPMVEELDFVGPFEVLSYLNKIRPGSTKVLLIAENKEPIQAFNGMRVIPDADLDECPQLDILVIPGGKGRMEAMYNEKIKKFILKQEPRARYITSVCTGAFMLAEAGLLKGKKATTYQGALAELAGYHEISVEQDKVVADGKVVTAGGVSSGLELGFYLLKELFDVPLAQEVADKIEYRIDVNNI